MRTRFARLLAFLLTIAIIITGCNLPGMNPPTPAPPSDAEYTQAAQTIIAGLTQAAGEIADTPTPQQETPSVPTTEVPTADTPTAEPSPTATPTEEPTETPTATPEATATEGPTATATLTSGDPRAALGNPSWRDTFGQPGNWGYYQDEYASFEYRAEGYLLMTNFDPGPRNAWVLAWPRPEDYYLEMTAETRQCRDRDRYGLILRSDASSGYWFLFSCDGSYSFTRWDGEANQGVRLVDWTQSQHINSGGRQTNRMGVWVDDNRFTLYANGNELTQVQDSAFTDPRFGLMIGSGETEDFRVEVEEIAYWDLP